MVHAAIRTSCIDKVSWNCIILVMRLSIRLVILLNLFPYAIVIVIDKVQLFEVPSCLLVSCTILSYGERLHLCRSSPVSNCYLFFEKYHQWSQKGNVMAHLTRWISRGRWVTLYNAIFMFSPKTAKTFLEVNEEKFPVFLCTNSRRVNEKLHINLEI